MRGEMSGVPSFCLQEIVQVTKYRISLTAMDLCKNYSDCIKEKSVSKT